MRVSQEGILISGKYKDKEGDGGGGGGGARKGKERVALF